MTVSDMLVTAILTAASHLPVLPVVLLDMVGRSKMKTTNGGFHATFDSLTVRKKMRVYELEVQKLGNKMALYGLVILALGDEVIALN